jgi:hypothetical protein
MMDIDKNTVSQIASGQIENPVIEVMIDGEKFIAKGKDARFFAVGVLVGIKSTHPESKTKFNNDIVIEE